MAAAQQNLVAQQDGLRTLRNFLSFASGAVSDQTYAGQDAFAVNPAGQFYTQTQYGVAVEGQPTVVARPQGSSGGMYQLLIVGGLVLAAYALLK